MSSSSNGKIAVQTGDEGVLAVVGGNGAVFDAASSSYSSGSLIMYTGSAAEESGDISVSIGDGTVAGSISIRTGMSSEAKSAAGVVVTAGSTSDANGLGGSVLVSSGSGDMAVIWNYVKQLESLAEAVLLLFKLVIVTSIMVVIFLY